MEEVLPLAWVKRSTGNRVFYEVGGRFLAQLTGEIGGKCLLKLEGLVWGQLGEMPVAAGFVGISGRVYESGNGCWQCQYSLPALSCSCCTILYYYHCLPALKGGATQWAP